MMGQLVKANESISGRFDVVDETGELVNADALPVGQLITNGVNDAATITVTNIATGDYRWQMTTPNDLVEGDTIEVRITATIDAINTAGKVFKATVVGRYPSENGVAQTADHTANIASILGYTNELQTNQGNWLTATGFAKPGDKMDLVDAPNATAVAAIQSGLSTFDHTTDEVSIGDVEGTDATDFFASMVSAIQNGLATSANVTAAQSAIISQGNTAWVTATGFSTHSAADVKTALEQDGSKLDHLWETTEDDGGTRRFTTNALEQAPAGGSSLTAQQVRDAMKLAPSAGAAEANSIDDKIDQVTGTQFDPAFPVELTIRKTGGEIVPEADVWATSEGTTSPILKSGESAPNGKVTLMLGAGRYDIYRDKEGINFGDPITIQVESDGSYGLG